MSQALDVDWIARENVEGDPLRTLGPTPGSRPNSSIRSWTTPSYTSVLDLADLRGTEFAQS